VLERLTHPGGRARDARRGMRRQKSNISPDSPF
jgi:hypothetical protein